MTLTPEQAARVAAENQYITYQYLKSGEWVGVQRFLFTFGLIVGFDEAGYRTRFCYESMMDAIMALAIWDGHGDPPGDWIKEKGRNERDNPARVCGLCGFTKRIGGCERVECPTRLQPPNFGGIPITQEPK